MKKINKILPQILMTLLVLLLVSAIVLSTAFAKYATSNNTQTYAGRPAAFEVVMKSDFDDYIGVNFAADGEPGNPLGHTRVTKDYNFSVIRNYTEVALTYELIIDFNSIVASLMYKGRTNPFTDGISCDYEVYEVINGVETKLSGTETFSGSAITKWTYTYPYIAPNPNSSDANDYILRVTFYNNTDMTANTNAYAFSSDAITITAEARQLSSVRSLSSIVNGEASAWNMSDMSKMLMTRPLSKNTQFDLQIPITQAGNYSLSFNANMELVKQGDSAYISVPKTVFKYKERIPITYNIFDASNITDGTAWIAITGSVGHEEVYAKWQYLEGGQGKITDPVANQITDEYLSGNPLGCAAAFVDSEGNLLPGNYRIYFIQGGGQFYSDGKFNVEKFLTDPINITILPPDDLSNQSVNKVENDNVMLSTPKAVYTYRDEIEISYNIKKALGTQSVSWVSIVSAVDDKYSCWKYLNDGTSGTVNLRTDETTNKASDFAGVCRDDDGYWLPGYYRIVLVDDEDTLNNNSLLSKALGILVLPKSTSDNISSWGTTPYGTASMTLNSTTNIFYTGEAMPISWTYNNLSEEDMTASNPWVARGLINRNGGTAADGATSTKGYYVYPSECPNDYTFSHDKSSHSFNAINTPGSYLLAFGGSTGNTTAAIGKPQIPMNYAPVYTPMIGVTVVKNHSIAPKLVTASGTQTGTSLNDLYTEGDSSTISFTATEADVNNGYVTLKLDFSNFDASTYYKLNVNGFSLAEIN